MADWLDEFETYWKWLSPIVLPIAKAILVWFIGSKLVKVLQKFLAKAFAKTKMDISVSKFLQSLIVFVVKALLIVAVITILGIPTTGIIAVMGSIGLTLGLALQGSLSNFAGGILILIAKPFKVGDYIVEDAHKNEGTVLAIDLLYTKLLTVDNKTVIIPNGMLANTSLTNVTAQAIRRLDINIGISYSSDMRLAKELLTNVISKDERVLKNKPSDVFVKSLEADCVLLETRVWVSTKDYWTVKWDLTERYKLIFDENGVTIPFTQLDVHIKNND